MICLEAKLNKVKPIKMKEFLHKFIADRRLRYLTVGSFNAMVGFICANALYYSLSPTLHIIIICILGNIICISFAFFTYKTIVFQTKGNWLSEYLRCYVIYGLAAVLGTLSMWALVDWLGLAFWLAQIMVMIFIPFLSYIGHSRFSFSTGPRRN